MNIYENLATEILVSIFKTSAYWKKEIVFNFLLKPFNKNIEDIKDVTSQETLKDTKPDFTIHLKDKIEKTKKEIHFEVKINNAELTTSEKKENSRDAFLIMSDYINRENIPLDTEYILTWEDFFDEIDKKEAMPCFEELSLLRNCLFGTNKDLDMEFLTQFLYSKDYVTTELKDIFTNLFNLIKKEEETEPKETDNDCEISLKEGKNTISLGYKFGDDYHVGNFYLYLNEDEKHLQLKENTEFLKKYDKVWYFYKHIEPFIKDNALIKTEKEILNGFLDKAEELSPKSYLQICQTILERKLYPELEIYAKDKKLIFQHDDLADIENTYYPKLYFHKKNWDEYFYITFEFDITDFIKGTKQIKFYYGIWAWNTMKDEEKNKYKILINLYKSEKLEKDKYSSPKKKDPFPFKTKRNERLSTDFFKDINNAPKNRSNIIETEIGEILAGLSEKGL